jgi:hypothetical protein
MVDIQGGTMLDTIDHVRNIVDMGIFIIIWLAQLIIYPSFEYTRQESFKYWHRKYSRLIALFVVPLLLIQLGLVAGQIYMRAGRLDILSGILVAGCWLSTFGLSVPRHHRLQRVGKDMETVVGLVKTNWPRTIMWTIIFVLGLLTAAPISQ